ncbi:MAG: hypothetical protein JO013_06915 [Alphaproteobacteria bacterium]|nr:hypothetical protein [Alphaproteobacteria bacterium]
MNSNDRAWLDNRVHAAVDDDFYLDRDEEKRIKEEASSRGIAIRDIELVIREELQKTESISERQLLDDLDRLLHQFTDDDKFLDRKEERDAFDQVVRAAPGKRKGLDPRVAEEYVTSFCRVNGIRRQTEPGGGTNRMLLPLLGALLLIVLVGAFLVARGGGGSSGGRHAAISQADKDEIDGHLRRATDYVERAQYTDPPERSAKAELDAVKRADPDGTYRKDEVAGLQHKIVDHYIALAQESARDGEKDAAAQWLGRARLIGVDAEQIDQKSRELGIEGR